jgi:hypothetical protein
MDQYNEIKKIRNAQSNTEIRELVLRRLKDNNYKLYQYCSIDENYDPFIRVEPDGDYNHSFRNVLDGIYYAGRPSKFNDPFDCMMGVSSRSLLSDIMKSFLNLNYINAPIDKKKIKEIFSDKKHRYERLQEVRSWKPSLIRDILIQMLENDYIYFKLVKDVSFEYLKSKHLNPLQMKMLIQSVFSIEEFRNSFLDNFLEDKYKNMKTSKKMNELFSQNDFLVDTLLLEPIEVSTGSDNSLNAINVNIEKMNLLGQTHGYKNIQQDTENLRTAIDSAFEVATDGLNEMYDRIDRHFGITCFSKKSDIALMWSHYANKHKGFVIEYDLSNLTPEDAEKLSYMLPVKYDSKRPRLDAYSLQKFKDSSGNPDIMDLAVNTLFEVLFVKAKEWSYEKEIRVITYISNESDRKVGFNYIKSIILGVNSSDDVIKLFRKMCMDKGYNLQKYELHEDEYKLKLIPCDIDFKNE